MHSLDIQSERRDSACRASASGSERAAVAAILPPEAQRAHAGLFRRVARDEHRNWFASLSGDEGCIGFTGGATGVCSANGIALLVAGSLRFRGERAWMPLDDAQRLGALTADWRAESSSLLEKLQGSFLLIAIDEHRGETIVAVDRMGVVPLCYALTGGGRLIFATSATLAAAHPLANAQLSAQALYNYLHFHMVPSPDTAFAGICKLEPAQFLRFRAGRVQLGRYWEPRFSSQPVARFEEYRERLLAALEGSVRRSVQDTPTGSFLSGGIDSSTVTGMLSRVGAHGSGASVPPAYSMGFEAQGYDEAHYAQIAARHFGAPLRQFYVTPDDVHSELMNVAAMYDEPFGNSSAIPTLVCARRAKSDGIELMLGGDGGDELFGGNVRYAKQKTFELYHGLPAWSRTALIEPLLLGSGWPSRVPLVSKLASYVAQARMPMPERTDSYNFLVRTPPASIFEPSFLSAIDPGRPFELMRERYAAAPSAALVDRMLYLDWKFTLADNDLRKVGRMCELAGVDVRYPWLDDEVVELSVTVPAHWKVRGRTLRYFVKRALDGFLPRAIITKSKHGFGLPFGEWLKNSPLLRDQVDALLTSLKRRSIVRPAFIDDLTLQHRLGHASYYGTMVWVLVMLEAWMQAQRRAL